MNMEITKQRNNSDFEKAMRIFTTFNASLESAKRFSLQSAGMITGLGTSESMTDIIQEQLKAITDSLTPPDNIASGTNNLTQLDNIASGQAQLDGLHEDLGSFLLS